MRRAASVGPEPPATSHRSQQRKADLNDDTSHASGGTPAASSLWTVLHLGQDSRRRRGSRPRDDRPDSPLRQQRGRNSEYHLCKMEFRPHITFTPIIDVYDYMIEGHPRARPRQVPQHPQHHPQGRQRSTCSQSRRQIGQISPYNCSGHTLLRHTRHGARRERQPGRALRLPRPARRCLTRSVTTSSQPARRPRVRRTGRIATPTGPSVVARSACRVPGRPRSANRSRLGQRTHARSPRSNDPSHTRCTCS
jgi:hypothetical protein